MTRPYEPSADEKRVIAWLRDEATKTLAKNLLYHDIRMTKPDFRAGYIEGFFVVADAIEQGAHHGD